ncbi:MAG: class I SAM-dependent methyltransferase, partial [Pseudomonadales bacterium]
DAREQSLLRRSLESVGSPQSIIDVGCGPGRFWSTIAEFSSARLAGLDVSHGMLRFARSTHSSDIGERIALAAGSIMELPFVDDAFDCVVSMRLLHHFGGADERRCELAELSRIARQNVIVSLWVDGNYKAWRRRRLELHRTDRAYQNRHVVSRMQLLDDFHAANLVEMAHFDLIPAYSQWRYYVLAVQGA